jgi:hypothetical protein
MKRLTAALLGTALLAMGAALLSASPAASQAATTTTTPYPGQACNRNSTSDLGTMAVGQVRTFTLTPNCVFTNGTPVTKSVNGTNVGTQNASAAGSVTVEVNAVSQTQLSIDDPVIVPAVCGTNRIVATGASAAAGGATVTHTGTFTLTCAATGTPPGGLSRTGQNLVRWSIAAAALIAVGAFLVIADRRRGRRQNLA